MTQYNHAVAKLDMPARIKRLPISHDGYPIPRFVAYVDGKPDFRIVEASWVKRCVRYHFCWLCGEVLGRHKVFTIGPMCAINRTSAEAPSHYDCARFAVQACPFLTQPKRPRNPHDMPDGHEQPGGLMIERNPGVTLLWTTKNYKIMPAGGGDLFKIGDPIRTEWWARGRPATREEILHSIETGLPALRKVADDEGPEAVKQLDKQITIGLALVPA